MTGNQRTCEYRAICDRDCTQRRYPWLLTMIDALSLEFKCSDAVVRACSRSRGIRLKRWPPSDLPTTRTGAGCSVIPRASRDLLDVTLTRIVSTSQQPGSARLLLIAGRLSHLGRRKR